MTQIDAGDLRAEIDADPADGDAGTLRHYRPRNAGIVTLVHGAASVILLDYPPTGHANATAHRIAGQRLFWQAFPQHSTTLDNTWGRISHELQRDQEVPL